MARRPAGAAGPGRDAAAPAAARAGRGGRRQRRSRRLGLADTREIGQDRAAGSRRRRAARQPQEKADMVLTDPPFGRKSSVTMVASDGKESKEDMTISRQDFWATTSNKQLNFVQHIRATLKIGGTAAIVLPDTSSSRRRG
ncbi:MAG: N-6 DNA methylase [Solirubrobacteraceae bacterium]